ncbi:HAD family hydrolase [Streptomyces thermolilacinus]|uniref:Haloacid dehalogenase n=1 Tax=Streptomyces thermolilacinus SPC6 TaxID=1306406 RepID=A0A1D3DVQ1_9ACTN|nr:HAD family phosphatase [Streptomyces thermolilacinus]OEJ96400.1 haloacid dehalogenase [Streptomyces thermolilacinus SPC6]
MTEPEFHHLQAKAALFDLDGTLVATEHRSRAAWTRLFTTHGLPCDDALLATFVGRRGQEALADHVHRFPGHTVDELFEEACGYLMGPDSPPPFAVPGAAELLADLHGRGVPLAVVTSGLRAHATELLDHVGGADLFQVIVTAEDVSAGKPDPQGYLAACQALGVHPADGLAFEDAPAGVRAAAAAGLRCVALTTTHPAADLAQADLVLPDLTTLRWARNADGS